MKINHRVDNSLGSRIFNRAADNAARLGNTAFNRAADNTAGLVKNVTLNTIATAARIADSDGVLAVSASPSTQTSSAFSVATGTVTGTLQARDDADALVFNVALKTEQYGSLGKACGALQLTEVVDGKSANRFASLTLAHF